MLVLYQIMGKAGVPTVDCVSGMCISCCISTAIVGLGGNLPLVMVPGLGLSTYLSYTLVARYACMWVCVCRNVCMYAFSHGSRAWNEHSLVAYVGGACHIRWFLGMCAACENAHKHTCYVFVCMWHVLVVYVARYVCMCMCMCMRMRMYMCMCMCMCMRMCMCMCSCTYLYRLVARRL